MDVVLLLKLFHFAFLIILSFLLIVIAKVLMCCVQVSLAYNVTPRILNEPSERHILALLIIY